jgi:hypothetical protein
MQEKNINDFYKHSEMGDGYLSFCKTCVKTRVHNHYEDNLIVMREKERQRYQRRKKDPLFIETKKKYFLNYVKRTGLNAQTIKGLHEKLKKLIPNNCEMCNIEQSKVYALHGHHSDYKKPLEVIWVCPACHSKIHRDLKNKTRSEFCKRLVV